jgi:hypothetical protein
MIEDNYRFSESDAVAHVDNLEQKMIVKEVKRRIVFQSTGETDEENGGFKKIERSKIDGIIVYWFEEIESGKKSIREQKFHSSMLVPYSVAQKGREAVDKWLDSKSKSSKFKSVK